jgi:drug/metabolite transporter (DMT)-like permease
MSFFVILIILISTFMHAGWNLLARYSHSEGEFYNKMLRTLALVGFIPAVVSELFTHSLTPTAWICVVGSGLCAALYMFSLAQAFESSDFTVVYPVARALPVVFVAMIDAARGRMLTPIGWTGILFVAFGCTLVPQKSFSAISYKNYIQRGTIWMLLAACGTVGYTMLDKIAAETVQQSAATAARYGYFYFSVSYIPYLFFFSRTKRQDANHYTGWKLAAIAAGLSFAAYWLVLWAYQLSPYASYIIAFRQFSIVIGSVMAFYLYKEEGIVIRLTGASMITAGLILIAGWGR